MTLMTILIDIPDEAVTMLDNAALELAQQRLSAGQGIGRMSRTSVARYLVLKALGFTNSGTPESKKTESAVSKQVSRKRTTSY